MNIENRIVHGLITSTEFIQEILPIWDIRLLEGPMGKPVAIWCMEYYNQFNKAPGKDIWTIFYAKSKSMDEDLAEMIEQDYLSGLEREEPPNLDYLLKQTKEYFRKRKLTIFAEDIQGLVYDEQLAEAEKMALEYSPVATELRNEVNFKDEKSLENVEKAFTNPGEMLIEYPRQLGQFWNRYLRRGGFVSLLSPEKRGKTWFLMDMSVLAAKQKRKVAFFQAGDMTEDEQILRICTRLTGRSVIEEYSGKMTQPVRDCIYNQMDYCDRPERACQVGLFAGEEEKEIRKKSLGELLAAREYNEEYRPCTNCNDYWSKRGFGTAWIRDVDTGLPLELPEAKRKFEEVFVNKMDFRLSTHINGTLTVREIRAILDIWERTDNFTPDVITIDYADILAPDASGEWRQQQNLIWQALRGLSQERECLVLTASQSDARSYEKDWLSMVHFSEDKRKLGHVTAMFGLNQDKYGREKDLGLMRINQIVLREGPSDMNKGITVLQNLKRGRPFIGSYF